MKRETTRYYIALAKENIRQAINMAENGTDFDQILLALACEYDRVKKAQREKKTTTYNL